MAECRIREFSISVSPLQRNSNSDINGLGFEPYFEFELLYQGRMQQVVKWKSRPVRNAAKKSVQSGPK